MAQEAMLIAEDEKKHSIDLGDFTSIEFRIQTMGTIYLSRLWKTAEGETCFLIKEGSAVLNHLTVGDEIDARFLTGHFGSAPLQLTTRIDGIQRETAGRFKGHYLIALTMDDENAATH